MTSLRLVPHRKHAAETCSEGRQLALVRSRLIRALEKNLGAFLRECQAMRETMTEVESRISKDGFAAKLTDLKSGRLYRIAGRIAVLQGALASFDASSQDEEGVDSEEESA
jgi:hypothetical protein